MNRSLKDSVINEVDFEMVLNQLVLEKFVKRNPDFKALKSLDSDIMESLRACGDCEGGGCDCNSSSCGSDVRPVSLRYDSKDIMESLRACGDCEGGGCDCNSSSCGSDVRPVSLRYDSKDIMESLRACGDCEGGGCDCNSSSCGSDVRPVSLKYKTEKKYNHLN